MTSGKNPYEIRFDVLSMARDLLDREYDLGINATHIAMEKFVNEADDPRKFFEEYAPKMYTSKDIISKANELYQFVSFKK